MHYNVILNKLDGNPLERPGLVRHCAKLAVDIIVGHCLLSALLSQSLTNHPLDDVWAQIVAGCVSHTDSVPLQRQLLGRKGPVGGALLGDVPHPQLHLLCRWRPDNRQQQQHTPPHHCKDMEEVKCREWVWSMHLGCATAEAADVPCAVVVMHIT